MTPTSAGRGRGGLAAHRPGAATGNTELVAEGNRDLLFREQRNVIDDDYRAMSARPVTGDVFTYVFTAVGDPSIPGAESFSEVFPINAEVRGGTDDGFLDRYATRCCPRGRGRRWHRYAVARRERRELRRSLGAHRAGHVPPYVDLVENHPQQAADTLSTPVADRVEEWRIVHRIDDIATNWEPYVDVDVRPDGSVFSVIGDGASTVWDWATGVGDAGPTAPVEVPTGTTTTTTPTPTCRHRLRRSSRNPSRKPGPPTGTIPGGSSPARPPAGWAGRCSARPPCSRPAHPMTTNSGGDDMTELRWDLRQPTTTRELGIGLRRGDQRNVPAGGEFSTWRSSCPG